ncbi:MAG TPA: hypothetical protein VGN81_33365 [Pseudonocardiaceae bacterium]|jgi:hypothetical protein
MTDYFGRLLGLSGANVVRPRLRGLFEPIDALAGDDVPVPTMPSVPDEPQATVLPLAERPRPPQQKTAQRPAEQSDLVHAETGNSDIGVSAGERRGGGLRGVVGASPRSEESAPSPEAARAGMPRLVRASVRAVRDTAPERVQPGVESRSAEPARVTSIQPVASNQPIVPVASIARIGQPVRPPTGLPTQRPVGAAPTPAAPNPAAPTPAARSTTAQQHQQHKREQVPSEPVIRVNIGRIEVTATTPPAAPTRRASKPRSSTQSLASYLAERDGGRT